MWTRGSVRGIRPPGFEFRILCLEGSVISLWAYLTILRRLSWPNLACMCTKVAKVRFISFLSFLKRGVSHEVAICVIVKCHYPVHTSRSPNVGLMLGLRRRRWANIEPTFGQRLVYTGYISEYHGLW